MSDLISRQAVEDITWEEPSYSDPLNVLTEVREKVRALPSVENKGEWINAKVGKLFPSNDYKCSVCGNILNFDGVNCGRGDANYCPNYGADMRGE